MYELSINQKEVLSIILEEGLFQSSIIYQRIIDKGNKISLVSVKRLLSQMVKSGFLVSTGSGRSTRYSVSILGRVFFEIDPINYISIEPDKRFGLDSYNFDLFSKFPNEVFNENELKTLKNKTLNYQKKIKKTSKTIQEKEIQRLIIELSWKSSKIEGNTYTLLDTEKLILENKEAFGHEKDEAKMILNHKDAFNFIRENSEIYKELTIANLEKLHSVLIKGLNVKKGIRNSLVGVIGSKYKPLDNIHQIKEAVMSLSKAVNKAKSPYDKALLAILGISYIQPFDDGNKRTGRLMANALLLAHNCAPLSYRSIDESEYRNAVLVFYEINSITSFKKIFIEQYKFATENYTV